MPSEIDTRDVEPGLLALPRAPSGAAPGCVLVHDVWGLGDHARDLTRRLAAEGFAVLGVDLYRNLGEVSISDPGEWMRGLSDPDILADLGAAARLLADLPETGAHAVGVVGFCMGGSYALLAGCERSPGLERVGAVVPFYGLLSHDHGLLAAEGGLDPSRKPRSPLAAAHELRCPLLGFFGGVDPYVPLEDVRSLRETVAARPFETEVTVYPEAGHAFVNDTRPDAYRETEAREAWGRMTAFLRRHL
ncbi:MAG: dienelactone hydrolase family protein [Myxococcota bacterium]